MKSYQEQVNLVASMPSLIRKSSVMEVEGHSFLTVTTMKDILSRFYDMHTVVSEDGISFYMTLFPEYKDFDFAPAYQCDVNLSQIENLEITGDKQRKLVMESIALENFTEAGLFEMLYIDAADAKSDDSKA